MENNSELLLNLLNRVLGSSYKTSGDNYAFVCPNNCHLTKNKLEINLKTHKYQCWICGGNKNGFKGNNLIKLFKILNVTQDKLEELKLIIKPGKTIEYTTEEIRIPKEYIPLNNIEGLDKLTKLEARRAISFLKKRNITQEDILKYSIGFCNEGKYNGRVIIPSYNENVQINYFIRYRRIFIFTI